MMPLILVLLAAATGPSKQMKPILSVDDYPLEAVRKGEQGQVMADLLINPSGMVETCTIVVSSGFAVLDQATCALLKRRARFKPAQNPIGHAQYDVVRTPPINWSLGSFHPKPMGPDYDLTINRTPNGTKLPLDFEVDYFVTRDGQSRECALSPDKSAPAELVALACRAVATAPAHIIRDRNGVPVETQEHATFRFSLDNAQSK